MVYDSARKKVILFGGQSAQGCCGGQQTLEVGQLLNDMWEWDGVTKTWTQILPASGPVPPPRSFFGIAYDVARNKVVIHGGKEYEVYYATGGDTWEWDPATQTWTNFPYASGIHYGGRRGMQMAYDPNLGQVIQFGGIVYWGDFYEGTYAWDGHDWILKSVIGPAGRQGHVMTTDFARSKVVLYGGYSYYGGLYDETWEWDGNSWTQVASAGPPRRDFGAMAYDSTRGVSVLFGGSVGNSYAASYNDTWEWNGTSWALRPMQTSPPPRDTVMAFDGTTMILFGGRQDEVTTLGDTWMMASTDTVAPVTAAIY
jgi:hypothetical protein